MQPDELDDLFRQELDGHATPPAADLWARLQARSAAGATPPAAADPLDARFQAGLAGHATPPRRELWERLEDEHLRPRQRRRPVVAWGRLAVAASLLLFVLAGGAGLWLRAGRPASGPVAATTHPQPTGQPGAPRGNLATTTRPATPGSGTSASSAARQAGVAALAAVKRPGEKSAPATAENIREKKLKNLLTQATVFPASPSSSPVASTTRPRRPATARRTVPRLPAARPDAAATLLAHHEGRNTSGDQPTPAPASAALAAATPAPTELQVIEVDVRRGTAPTRPAVAAAPVLAADAAPAAERRRPRLGGLLRQAGHALRGESVSLAEATGLPESVTVQAHLGGRLLSKTIQL